MAAISKSDKCMLCKTAAAVEPWYHDKCGKDFCQLCLEKYGKTNPCPICYMEEAQYFKNHNVSCKFSSIGCDWNVKRKDASTHEADTDIHLNLALDTVIKLQATVAEHVSHEKSWTVKLADFKKKKENDWNFMSEPFYTSPKGYKLSIRIDPNGYGRGKSSHLSIHASILKGEHDDEIEWPFEGVLTFDLLNQLENTNHHTMKLHVNAKHNANTGSNWGFTRFIEHSKLSRDLNNHTQYLKDDTLYCRLSVNVSSHKTWLESTV